MAAGDGSLRVEVPGKAGDGAEFRLTVGSTVSWTQSKRQTDSGVWTLASLGKEGFLQSWVDKLRAAQPCEFASMTSADQLYQLCERASDASDFAEFKSEFLKSEVRKRHFAVLRKIWRGVSEKEAFEFLRLVTVHTMDERNLNKLLELTIRTMVRGNTKAAGDALMQYADEIVHKEVSPGDIWAYLADRDVYPAASSATVDPSHHTTSERAWLDRRIGRFPPVLHHYIEAAFESDAANARRLVTLLTSEDKPAAVLADWQQHRPGWLEQAGWDVQLAASELASAFRAQRLAADLLTRMADQGAPPRYLWLAKAALLYSIVGDSSARERALTAYSGCAASDHPYARAMAALFAGDLRRADELLDAWDPPKDELATAATLSVQVALGHPDSTTFSPEVIDNALSRSVTWLSRFWFAGLAIWRSRALITRARQRRSRTLLRDLTEAQALALRARNDRRVWQGDSSEAAALACQAANMRGDLKMVLHLGLAPEAGGTATPTEADASDVAEQVAYAAVFLGRIDIAEAAAGKVDSKFCRTQIRAMILDRQAVLSAPTWREAISLAGEDHYLLLLALIGLAKTGATDLPRIDELERAHPDEAAEVRATAALAAGNANEAISALRTERRRSLTAAVTLADAYRDIEDTESAVQTLLDAADDFNDPQPRLWAAHTLAREGQTERAEAILSALLADQDSDWPDRPTALKLAAELALNGSDLRKAFEFTQAALAALPEDAGLRWALIQALMLQDNFADAWAELSSAPEPFEPDTVGTAQMWIELHRRFSNAESLMRGCLSLLTRFGDSEEFSAYVLSATLITPAASDQVPADLLSAYQRKFEEFFTRWPDSSYLHAIGTEDEEAMLQALTESLRPSPERAADQRRLTRELSRGEKPLIVLAGYTGRPYSEILIRRGMGTLPSEHPDPREHGICIATVAAATDHDVAVDTSALVVMNLLPQSIRNRALGLFRRVRITNEIVRDIRDYEERLAKDAGTLYYDPDNDRPALAELSEADRQVLIDQTQQLRKLVAELPRQSIRVDHTGVNPRLKVQTSVLHLAAMTSVQLWCDDATTRLLVRNIGIASFSTSAVLDHLLRVGQLSLHERNDLRRLMIRERVGDFAPDIADLITIASEEGWQAGAAAAALARPQAWQDPIRTAGILRTLLRHCHDSNPSALSQWFYSGVYGAAMSRNSGRSAVEMTATLLAGTLLAHGQQEGLGVQLVGAARHAVRIALPPDTPAEIEVDPLPVAVRKLRVLVGSGTQAPPHEIPRAILQLLSGLDVHDSAVVTGAILAADT
ncbi:tetratricopeptide repeat protein [Hamadaea flava]|uniref:Tetratricopeptide repeat protein n=2 Tax=Hamadaea flava TaxID=1742688 RepID=A0ABV8LZD4_9ACTN